MTLELYNTLSKRTETFRPLDPAGAKVLMYTCGPTVYDYAHIGNFRSFLTADVLCRTLELCGYDVTQVMNMTDVGHMTDDDLADGGGEDKMQVAARRIKEAKKAGALPAGVAVDPTDPLAIADFYAGAFLRDARRLGLRVIDEAERRPELMPRPTHYIQQMIALVERLIEKGHAYVGSDGVVYFDTLSFPAYGQLSGNTVDAIRSGEGGRVDAETQALKKHPADFMLWKSDERHLMRWESPWGEGYPGWHLECSVMAAALLGDETDGVIDLHTGGEDNIFPHHECEIAQSCAASGQQYFARYWTHTRFLNVEGEKMSKSKGNFFTLEDMVARGATPAALRLELIRMHYRQNANFTIQGVKDCQRQIDRWAALDTWLGLHADVKIDGDGALADALERFKAALCADLNISGALAALNEGASAFDVSAAPSAGGGPGTLGDEREALRAINSVLGVLDLEREADVAEGVDAGWVESQIAARKAAREAKDWAAADRIRDELAAAGVALKDSSEGTTWKRVIE